MSKKTNEGYPSFFTDVHIGEMVFVHPLRREIKKTPKWQKIFGG